MHPIPWGNVEICIYIMLFEFHYNHKIPTSGEYISDRRRTNPDHAREGGLILIGALVSFFANNLGLQQIFDFIR